MIEIHDLRKIYSRAHEEVVACDVAALSIAAGEQVALVGRSGCGKSTLLNLIAGMSLPDEGSLSVDGIDITNLGEAARDRFRATRIGMVFQTFNLLQPFTALENVMLGAVFGKSGKGGMRARATALLERVGLGDRLAHRPNQLSVGQAQRVAICRAMIHDPRLILADEPIGNQDKATGHEVLQILLDMARADGRTVVMVTHDPGDAARLDRTIELSELRRAS